VRLLHAGKVRDVYEAGPDRLLLVASDRISAFDVVLPEPVPDKGRVLTATTAFWFEHLRDLPNHLVSVAEPGVPAEHVGRAMLVRRCRMLPVECVVRGYLAGSAWKEYAARGTVHGAALPSGLREADRLPEPLFTPTTKAPVGMHDEPMTFDEVVATVGAVRAEEARALSLEVYRRLRGRAEDRGFLLADTKLELGVPLDGDADAPLVLADEVGTPDSSRFWLRSEWQPGRTPPGYDKQPVRDWLEASGWDKQPPAPHLPAAVVAATRQRYVEAYERLSGRALTEWPGGAPQ
jgi:phosphoribosylaminoimidazole-succinocarboxamide synthase